MAEILGLVASGISVAQLAGQILSAGLKIKRLLDQVNQVPEHLTLLVSQIESLAIVLSDLVQQDDDSDLAIPSATRGTLQSSVAQCQQALEQVKAIAAGLSAQIGTARGARRKLLAFKVVLRKDFILACERRLNMAMNLLLLAQQSYILAFQRMQPSLLLSLIEEHADAGHCRKCAIPGREEEGEAESLKIAQREHTDEREMKSGAVRQRHNWLGAPAYQFGITPITGRIDVRFAKSDTPDSPSAFKIHLQLPPWMSRKHLETIVRQSRGDWTTVMRVYRTHSRASVEWQRAYEAIEMGDLLSLRKQFDSRVLTPHDRIQMTLVVCGSPRTCDQTLMDTAIALGALGIGRFLAGYGVNMCSIILTCGKSLVQRQQPTDKEWETELLELIRKGELPNILIFSLFMYFKGPVALFQRLRRLIWTDNEFYSPDFGCCSKGLGSRALFIDLLLLGKTASPGIIRQILSRDGRFPPQEDLAGTQMSRHFSGWSTICVARSELQAMVSLTGSRYFGPEILLKDLSATQWQDLTRDLISMAPTCRKMRLGNLWKAIYDHFHSYLEWIDDARLDDPRRFHPRYTRRWPQSLRTWHKRVRALTEFSESVLRRWISLLANLGCDLTEFGITQKRMIARSRDSEDGEHLPLFAVALSWNDTQEVRLVGLEHGARASDWRFWWSEPSDGFAGEFWSLVDRDVELEEAIKRIPGGWVEDEHVQDRR